MHLEILVEDSSGAKLLELLVPKIIGSFGEPHTWRIHPYRGIGHIPKGLKSATEASQRILLDRLPTLLRGFGRTAGIDGVVVVVDADTRDCADFLSELKCVAAQCGQPPRVLFRIAIEEIEAWYFGDRNALLTAYPRARQDILNRYTQDQICGTWEMLADAIHNGGSSQLKKLNYVAAGTAKHEWASRIGPSMNISENLSPSFIKFRDGLIAFTQ